MAYKALYRKWRPKTFDDVFGQEHVTTTLKNEIAAGRPSHAYLFCGTRGTGKTTCSKILAKAVNCPNRKDGNPCCECDICRGIDDGSILDVTEIDAASNSGVDNIRELREEAFYTPAVCSFRVYIIDEAHMLSTGAFNALLKIMEEPPAHVLFILATTEIHKVPATILSRCQRFDFKRIESGVITETLLRISDNEDFELTPDAAGLIARLSDGALRDAISLLDLCVSWEREVTAEVVRERAGLVEQEYLFEIASAVNAGDSGGIFSATEGLWEKSIDYQRLCEQLIGFYRNLMVAKTVPNPGELIQCLPDELEKYKSMAASTSIEDIMYRLDVLQSAFTRMPRVTARRTELEIALLRLCSRPAGATSEGSLEKRLEKLESAVKSVSSAPSIASRALGKTDSPRAPQSPASEPVPTGEEISRTKVEPFDKWGEVLMILSEKNKPLHGALAGSKAYIGGDLLLVDAGELFARLVREDGYAKESLRDAVMAAAGRKYRLGPYNPDRYEPAPQAPGGGLDELISKAGELGVDVKIQDSGLRK